jgi:hypothetical protein
MICGYCLCGTEATKRPTVHPPDDTRVNLEQWWNDTDGENRRTQEKNLSQWHFVHHNGLPCEQTWASTVRSQCLDACAIAFF